MKKKGLITNMQTDAAAFEAWALALFHCGAQAIQIGLDADANAKGQHYQRFLYRLERFSELFPGRVRTEGPVATALDTRGKRLLNQPNSHKNPLALKRKGGCQQQRRLARNLGVSPREGFGDFERLQKLFSAR